MSDRERWIVYPLICFAFLLAARDKYAHPELAEFRRVRCQELQVVSDTGKSLISLYGSLEEAGVIVVYSHGAGGEPGDVPQVDPLLAQSAPGSPVVEVGADGHLGFVNVNGREGEINLKLGHDRANAFSGLYAVDRDEELLRESTADGGSGVWGVHHRWQKHETDPTLSEAASKEIQAATSSDPASS